MEEEAAASAGAKSLVQSIQSLVVDEGGEEGEKAVTEATAVTAAASTAVAAATAAAPAATAVGEEMVSPANLGLLAAAAVACRKLPVFGAAPQQSSVSKKGRKTKQGRTSSAQGGPVTLRRSSRAPVAPVSHRPSPRDTKRNRKRLVPKKRRQSGSAKEPMNSSEEEVRRESCKNGYLI